MKLTPEQVREKIENAPWYELNIWICIIMKWQEEDEISDKHTKYRNGRGLSAAHASKITWFAEMIKKGYRLNDENTEKAREILLHYCKQFAANTT